MNSTVCPIGRKDSCEDYPEVTQEGLCGLLFETARPWKPIVDRMDGLSAASCPLSPVRSVSSVPLFMNVNLILVPC